MNLEDWDAFRAARESFRRYCEALPLIAPGLEAAQQRLVDARNGPAYTVETPVLYNFRLDEVNQETDIKLILVADNPGRREQAAGTRRYLAGPSGKIAARFFREYAELGIDFDRNVLILNKTPVHTPRTNELRELCRLGGDAVAEAVEQSQRFMAELLARFGNIFSAPVWITGYSEMKPKGIFGVYTGALQGIYGGQDAPPGAGERVLLFRHFSMNQFSADINRQREDGEPLPLALERIGRAYRRRVLGW